MKIQVIEFLPLNWIYRSISINTVGIGLGMRFEARFVPMWSVWMGHLINVNYAFWHQIMNSSVIKMWSILKPLFGHHLKVLFMLVSIHNSQHRIWLAYLWLSLDAGYTGQHLLSCKYPLSCKMTTILQNVHYPAKCPLSCKMPIILPNVWAPTDCPVPNVWEPMHCVLSHCASRKSCMFCIVVNGLILWFKCSCIMLNERNFLIGQF